MADQRAPAAASAVTAATLRGYARGMPDSIKSPRPRDDKRYPRGTAYHEAGHAVVAWSFGLQIGTISIQADDASGSTQIAPADHLGLVEQIAVCAAGYTAEKMFDYHTHYYATVGDYDRIRKLLEDHGISKGEEAAALRSKGADCARDRLLANQAAVSRLAERLVQSGSVGEAEFLRLMEENGK
jgi:hypothetical protein